MNDRLPGHQPRGPGPAGQGQPEGGRRAGAQRGQPQGPDHQLQHHHRRPGQPPGRPPRHPARAPAGAGGGQPRVRRAQRILPQHARLRPRDPPGRPRDAGHDRGVAALDRPDPGAGAAQRARRLDRPAAAGGQRPGRLHRRLDQVPAAGRPLQPLRAEQPAPDRRRGHPRRRAVHRRQQPGRVLPEPGRAVRRVAELRRQRQLRALPDRRRRQHRRPPARSTAAAKLFANFIKQPLGTRPARPSRTPPILRTSPCYKQKRARPEQRQDGAADPDADPSQARARLPGAGLRGPDRPRPWAATSCPTSASTRPSGCR